MCVCVCVWCVCVCVYVYVYVCVCVWCVCVCVWCVCVKELVRGEKETKKKELRNGILIMKKSFISMCACI